MAIGRNRHILITGAPGLQGGAAVPYLSGYGHRVRVLTRNPEKAKGLTDSNVEVIQGDSRKRETLKKALDGVDGVFLITPSEEGPEAEATAGKAMVDACTEKEIGHVVYSSVCCANKKTRVPYFESKGGIEDHLKESGLSYTILRPVWFMEHFASPWYRPSIEKGVLSTPLHPDRPLQMISAGDIGRIVAEAFTKPMKFVGREIDIAGDQLTMKEIAEGISHVLSHPVRYEHIPGSRAEKAVGKDWVPVFRWLDEHGYDADIWLAQSLFNRYEITLTPFREYLEKSRLGLGKAA
jgi:uncharacterized protein YbjT (DUF2867 family)